ncbi:unnamed protein product [Onchocerca flexuosa]|uniref:Uncharacterized protein n=1 Tax=Onchocerca flexuosa TaxID=387005 RepID=A0A183GZ09_9BILA|nr:unnamed protein product [Onchocerca flexuosa]
MELLQISSSTDSLMIVDLIENFIYVQMEKEVQVSLDRHFLFTCQLAPPPGQSLIEAQNGETLLPNRIPKYGLSSQEAEPEFKLENNWGNWPINSILISSTPISASISSEGKFENWPLELSTTGEMLSIDKLLITSATTSATDVSTKSSENLDTLMKILGEIKFWHSIVFTPLFSNKISSEMNTNLSTTTAMDKKETALAARENSTSRTKPLESVQIFATQLPNQKPTTDTAIYMEIQDNDEVPFGNTINRPIQIGENISLVIRSRSRNLSNALNHKFKSCNKFFEYFLPLCLF